MSKEEFDELVMLRCFDLARLGAGRVKTNPLVGAVLVYEGKVIGEGFHEYFGGAHAEVNAIESVPDRQRSLLSESTLYISLEPCSTFGKTPPCTNLILDRHIPTVVVSCLDPSSEMQGKSLNMLAEKGVEIRRDILQAKGLDLILAFRTNILRKRPYVILKYARSRSGFFAPSPPQRHWLTDPMARRLVHRWRAESDAILVGYQTAITDDPSLSNRYYFGSDPQRIVLDPHGKLPLSLRLFQDGQSTWRVREATHPPSNLAAATITEIEMNDLSGLMGELYRRNIGTLLVEGGAETLRSFMEQDLWDEARVLTGPNPLDSGIRAPDLPLRPSRMARLGKNQLHIYFHPHVHDR